MLGWNEVFEKAAYPFKWEQLFTQNSAKMHMERMWKKLPSVQEWHRIFRSVSTKMLQDWWNKELKLLYEKLNINTWEECSFWTSEEKTHIKLRPNGVSYVNIFRNPEHGREHLVFARAIKIKI
jgi:hypothetical protein